MLKFFKKHRITTLIILLIVLPLAIFTVAKFVKLDFHSYFLNAKNFYLVID